MVRPREGSHSAGPIIRFETSGGSGTEEAPLTVPEHHSLDQVTYLCKRQDRSQGDRDRFSPPGFDVAFFWRAGRVSIKTLFATNDHRFVLLDGYGESAILPPRRLSSFDEFADTILKLRNVLVARQPVESREFIASACYLLGWFLGDLGKHYRNETKPTMDIDIQLTRKHPENLVLGEYVAGCIRRFGIGCKRTPDRPSRGGLPNGAYCWASQRHPIFAWFHVACLGLKWHERTSYDAVRMDWMLSAPREDRLWFLRGLADSDGDVHFRDKSVDITTSPNTSFVKALLDSLNVHNIVRFTKGYGAITIRADQAMGIAIFNPQVNTYRRNLLERLVGANVYPRHWPSWLTDKVDHLIRLGLSKREICEHVLYEDNTYIKMHNLGRKMQNRSVSVHVEHEQCETP